MPILLPPSVALLGLVATVLVIRTRCRVRHSLYTTIRSAQTREIERARRRVLAAKEGRTGETRLELAFGLISLAAALGLVLMGVMMAIGVSE